MLRSAVGPVWRGRTGRFATLGSLTNVLEGRE